MEKILAEVKSPFTDEQIKEMILLFLQQKGDTKSFYRAINNVDIDSQNQEMLEFKRELFRNSGTKYQVSSNDFWMMVRGNEVIEDFEFEYYKYRNSNHYRVYLNLPEDKKESFIKQYMVACQEQGVELNFKFSLTDKRYDQFVAVCPCEDKEQFKRMIEIIKLLVKGIELGPLPQMIGEYGNKIGIAEGRKTFSYTEDVINMLRTAISINLIENSDRLIELTEDKELINTINFLKNHYMDDIECLNIRGMEDGDGARDMIHPFIDHSKELFKLFEKLIKIEPSIIESIGRDFKNIAKIDRNRSENIIFGSDTEKLINQHIVEGNNKRSGSPSGFGDGR